MKYLEYQFEKIFQNKILRYGKLDNTDKNIKVLIYEVYYPAIWSSRKTEQRRWKGHIFQV